MGANEQAVQVSVSKSTERSMSPLEILLRDPLSDVTRTERRNLFAVSLAVIALAVVGLVPTKIAALGIEFSNADQRAVLLLAAAVTLYFLAAFVIYAWSDYFIRGYNYQRAINHRLEEEEAYAAGGVQFRPIRAGLVAATILPAIRAFFEFGLPVFVGIMALVLALSASAHVAQPGSPGRAMGAGQVPGVGTVPMSQTGQTGGTGKNSATGKNAPSAPVTHTTKPKT